MEKLRHKSTELVKWVKKKKNSTSQQKHGFMVTRLMFFQTYVNPNRITESSRSYDDAPGKEKGIRMGSERRWETFWGDKFLIRAERGKQTWSC